MKTDIGIVFMLEGMSSRFGGKPKHLIRVGPNDETLIEISLKQALTAEFTKIIFIVSKKTKRSLVPIFGDEYRKIPIKYVSQIYNPILRDRPWGTNDAISQLYGIINFPVIICNGDDLYGPETFQTCVKKMIKYNENVTIGFKLKNVLPDYGKVNRGFYSFHTDSNHLKYINSITEMLGIEKSNFDFDSKELDSLVSMNFIGLQPNTINLLNNINIKFKKDNSFDRNIECYLPSAISSLIKQNIIQMLLFPTTEKWYGITNPGDEQQIIKALAIK